MGVPRLLGKGIVHFSNKLSAAKRRSGRRVQGWEVARARAGSFNKEAAPGLGLRTAKHSM